ncbi:chromosomal replication initiator DnaA [Sphingomonas gilva]|uniref:Chromosomal replication initiator DnaA n=1 Tax=Sphingomonas gilva TaxID=2305907 RepID=A0A396RL35_9SPHN|nr:chromosomal replication initiator DnaA [Sphingomonas gilva]RHW16256.1 chromosomal replication initiator DnaA [Sphingomonas gilva]
MSQIALPLDWPADATADEFLIDDSNRAAVRHLEHWGAWPVMASVLAGPRKSGRSLLGRIFRGQTGGQVIDDADRADEEAMFHAWNAAQATRRPLLLIAETPPGTWGVRLPDLRSRLAATPVVAIEPPSQALVEALAAHLLARRGLDARGDLTRWIAHRIERSHIAVMRAVDALDEAALSRHRRLTIPLARAALVEAGLVGEAPPEVETA